AAFIETVPDSGKLDLVVANYAHFDNEAGVPQLCEQKSVHGASLMTSCGPRHYTPIKAVLFRNQGSGRFAPPLTLAMTSGRGLGVAGCDYDGSGRPGIVFTNDETTGDLLQNKGAGTFANVGTVSGTAYDRDGNVHGGMGVDWGDYDNDGRIDLLVATFQNEPKSLYHNEGGGIFTDMAYLSGIGTAAYANVAFGCKFVDFDNDGWLDIVLANGHVQDNIAEIDSSTNYRQSLQLFRNRGLTEGKRVTFEDVSRQGGADFGRTLVGRGLAIGDFDNDGRMDLLVVDSEGKPLLLHNQVQSANHWLGVRLIGTRSNRDGYGAILRLQAGGLRQTRLCHADGSYMSSSDPRVHFGLGSAARVEELIVQWPSGQTDRLSSIPVDRYITLREGQGILP
ncbi:MAG TPA: CRTAC1 family protein, partial [Chthonomonadaceae bacterium]|nr:CRTAC1 family protein [Chthonomonadaceae bacterium]